MCICTDPFSPRLNSPVTKGRYAQLCQLRQRKTKAHSHIIDCPRYGFSHLDQNALPTRPRGEDRFLINKFNQTLQNGGGRFVKQLVHKTVCHEIITEMSSTDHWRNKRDMTSPCLSNDIVRVQSGTRGICIGAGFQTNSLTQNKATKAGENITDIFNIYSIRKNDFIN